MSQSLTAVFIFAQFLTIFFVLCFAKDCNYLHSIHLFPLLFSYLAPVRFSVATFHLCDTIFLQNSKIKSSEEFLGEGKIMQIAFASQHKMISLEKLLFAFLLVAWNFVQSGYYFEVFWILVLQSCWWVVHFCIISCCFVFFTLAYF